ncbi:hypothetical protein ACQ86N_45145 [Puia sp. P3]|uniref:hypothetical protein n=1 Tax=Puia sp. P3 TaxID=3423952 RepID=UPI003D665E49
MHNTTHTYTSVSEEKALNGLVQQLLKHKEICFDTETTGLDANNAELVGMSFSITPGEAWYIPCPADQDATKSILKIFAPLFEAPDIVWIGQNLKYDLLVLSWYGVTLKGELFDTMLAHYVIDPEGKRGMDLLSAKYLGYEPVHIEELIGKKERGS